jgi:hypothetical protein
VVDVAVVIFATITVSGLTEGKFMLVLLYCLSLCLRFDRVVHVVVVILSTITV